LSFLFTVFIFISVSRADGLDDLIRLVDSGKVLSVPFEQRVYSHNGELQSEYKGHLWFSPARNFRIEYTDPVKETIITNDSGYVDYVADDDELMTGDLSDMIFISPFEMLSKADEIFEVSGEGDIFRLRSKSEDSGDIEMMNIEFGGSDFPKRLTLDFFSGNIVVYRFRALKVLQDAGWLFRLDSYRKTALPE